jgi:hypothetical protein
LVVLRICLTPLWLTPVLIVAVWRITDQGKLKKTICELQEENRQLREQHDQVLRSEWIKNIPSLSYRNELEVEIKFLYGHQISFTISEGSDVAPTT